jgi:hypothetical protein
MSSDGKSSHCLWQGEQKQQTVDYIMKYHIFHHKMSQIDSLYINEIGFMVFNTTFNNISVISWQSVLLVEELGGPRENHRPAASH